MIYLIFLTVIVFSVIGFKAAQFCIKLMVKKAIKNEMKKEGEKILDTIDWENAWN